MNSIGSVFYKEVQIAMERGYNEVGQVFTEDLFTNMQETFEELKLDYEDASGDVYDNLAESPSDEYYDGHFEESEDARNYLRLSSQGVSAMERAFEYNMSILQSFIQYIDGETLRALTDIDSDTVMYAIEEVIDVITNDLIYIVDGEDIDFDDYDLTEHQESLKDYELFICYRGLQNIDDLDDYPVIKERALQLAKHAYVTETYYPYLQGALDYFKENFEGEEN